MITINKLDCIRDNVSQNYSRSQLCPKALIYSHRFMYTILGHSVDRVMDVAHSGNRCLALLTSGTFYFQYLFGQIWIRIEVTALSEKYVNDVCQIVEMRQSEFLFSISNELFFLLVIVSLVFIILSDEVRVQSSKFQQVFRLGHERCWRAHPETVSLFYYFDNLE